MRIHQDSINQIHSRLQIEEVIGDYVVLKKRGKDLWGLCPFHHEKTPSFSVVPAMGFYKCFGCDAKGDTINFLIQHHNISYIEALHLLAEKYGVVLKQSISTKHSSATQQEEEALYTLLGVVEAYFEACLKKDHEDRSPQAYLYKRGITEALIAKFHLGYSPDQWQALYNYATDKGYGVDLLSKAGLVKRKENKVYDLFRHRIIFPIHNLAGMVIGFGGRRLDEEEETAKYINSPETPVYKKGEVLYGLYQAKQSIREHSFCYLVEGYTDVIAMHSVGLSNVVASSGTSLTPAQIKLLSRFTKEVTLLFDSDTAGSDATLRSIDLLVAQDFDIKVASLPVGQDPASYVIKKGKDFFAQYINTNVQNFVAFKIKSTVQASEKKDISAQHKAIQTILATLALMPDGVKRALYSRTCSKLLDLPLATIEEGIIRLQTKAYTTSSHAKEPSTPKDPPKESTMLYILLRYSTCMIDEEQTCGAYLMKELSEELFTSERYKNFFVAFKQAWQLDHKVTAQAFLKDQPESIKQTVIDLVPKTYEPGAWDVYYKIELPKEDENLSAWCYKTLQRLKFSHLRRLLKDHRFGIIQAHRKASTLAISEQEVTKLITNYKELQKTFLALSKQLDTPPILPQTSHNQPLIDQ